MTRKDAYEKLLRLCERHGAELDGYLSDIQKQVGEEDFDTLRRIVGRIMGTGLYEAFETIAGDVPELTPNWMKRD
ncbi:MULTISPECIES: hypothetical protein [unclassified Mesorhizobium]|uniref:hypothetical protein n=1 Tax=unclassified Mesorhizobium TaxID=325217 RepID=UPI000FD9997C|nr:MULTISPECIES: hypothetical protein [unclassified Mesorhizobium]TGR38220.1 hypothetical protein EN842_45085 [bacterium M00.F.Ca.ET.199.01.1.1]TGU26503.1 hypothetical protein EN799_41640 [bacterium M00.F.Ca.ET.156.01.1.1]TGV83219.1 hypothetical protein EN792_025415 [Mesorhizobium sp. M00.F.Ca.ET.149.01.1.1]TGR19900.1 hypothetical protein EN845_25210 [Mesorhizobium sp. M8A.F.Ca.ET.202.01.1.1]TGR21191.1 hypothetical protein EN840_25040 [Mesorhizobium sp. M8A.F.Ca.ET.197.01.1.1]